MAELLILSGKLQGRRMTLPAGDVVIGRDEGCQIRMGSSEVSRRHCRLRVLSDGITAEDLGSRNGSYVNDIPISGVKLLKPGDILRVGPMSFQVPVATLETAPPARPKPSPAPAAASAATPSTPTGAENAARSAPRAKKLTDDDIAAWLTDEEEDTVEAAPRRGDTTIVTMKSIAASEETSEAVPVSPDGSTAATPSADKRKAFRSVKDEAADIIRRHHEALRKKSETSK